MREINCFEIDQVAGAGFFKELGRLVGEAHNSFDEKVGEVVSTAIALMKNEMYQEQYGEL